MRITIQLEQEEQRKYDVKYMDRIAEKIINLFPEEKVIVTTTTLRQESVQLLGFGR